VENLYLPFSILERIDVGETKSKRNLNASKSSLSVSSNGSTWVKRGGWRDCRQRCGCSFSILERIDVGETLLAA